MQIMQGQGLRAWTPSQMLLLSNQACFWQKGLQQEVRFTSVSNLQLHQLAVCLTAAQSYCHNLHHSPSHVAHCLPQQMLASNCDTCSLVFSLV